MDLLPSTLSPWHLLATLLSLSLLYLLSSAIRTRYRSGLRQLPGPFVASISNLDRLYSCYKGHQMLYHLSLHRQYGPFVRIGPNHVSFSDSSLIPQIYSISSKFYKSDFYKMFDIKTPTGPMPTIFSVRDEGVHKTFKRPVAGAYAMSALRELEPMNDECSAIFMKKMDGLVGIDVDLGVWVHDTITSITFSNRLGFMQQERDIHSIIAAINGRLFYNSIIGQVPSLHRFLFGNAFVAWLANFIPSLALLNSSRYIVQFTAEQLARYQSEDKVSNVPDNCPDMLSRFRRFKDGESVMSDSELLSHTSGNIFAGSDTTAASLRSIFYHLCRHPSAHAALLAEIDAADATGGLSDPVTFAEAQTLPYLQAVIKEALRMHPAVGLLLERVVPAGGWTLPNGVQLPAGTVVGMNPWVAARDTTVYGEDAGTFRPERWLDASEASDEGKGEALKAMERNFMAFGGGTRTCLGRNVSMLEMSKLVPQVLRRFEFELSDPEREWEMRDYWFVQQTGLICKVKRREK